MAKVLKTVTMVFNLEVEDDTGNDMHEIALDQIIDDAVDGLIPDGELTLYKVSVVDGSASENDY